MQTHSQVEEDLRTRYDFRLRRSSSTWLCVCMTSTYGHDRRMAREVCNDLGDPDRVLEWQGVINSLDQCDLSMGQEFLRQFRNLLAEWPVLATLGTLYNQYRLLHASNLGWPKLPLHRSDRFIPKKEI